MDAYHASQGLVSQVDTPYHARGQKVCSLREIGLVAHHILVASCYLLKIGLADH